MPEYWEPPSNTISTPEPERITPFQTFYRENRHVILVAVVVLAILGVVALVIKATDTKIVIGLIAAAIGLLTVLWLVPRAQITFLPKASELASDRRQELEDKARATLAQVIGGTFFLLTGYFTWQGIESTKAGQEKQFQISNATLENAKESQKEQFGIATRGQMTDRFTKAIEQLNATGPGDITKRLGGIYALESIAKESNEDHATIVEILAAYIRQKRPRQHDEQGNFVISNQPVPEDVQAVLTVLGRRTIDKKYKEHGILNLNATDLSSALLDDAILIGAKLTKTSLYRADLTHTKLNGSDLEYADLTEADLFGADLSEAHLTGADFTGADLTSTRLTRANLFKANLNRTELSSADFSEAKLTSATLIGTNLSGANLKKAILTGADLTEARSLGGTDLSGANLSNAKLIGAALDETNFTSVQLIGTDLSKAMLRKAKFIGNAILARADLIQSDLSEADFTSADLSEANLTGADFTGADLSKATNLTQNQLNTIGKANKNTKVPTGLKIPQQALQNSRPQVDFRR